MTHSSIATSAPIRAPQAAKPSRAWVTKATELNGSKMIRPSQTRDAQRSGQARNRRRCASCTRRTALAPELPTIEETLGLKDFDLAAWTGLFGPAGMPKDVVKKVVKVTE